MEFTLPRFLPPFSRAAAARRSSPGRRAGWKKCLRRYRVGIHWRRWEDGRGDSSSIGEARGGAVQFNQILRRMLRPQANGLKVRPLQAEHAA
jgi:hypothetical protein